MSDHSDNGSFTVKQTNVQRPQLQHTNSQQSVTASEDYLSASSGNTRPNTSSSNEVLQGPVNRMSALFSHPHNPHDHETQPLHPQNEPGLESFLPQTQETFQRLRGNSTPERPTSGIRRKPVPSQQPSPSSSTDSGGKVSETVPDPRATQRSSGINGDTTTPGDNTPYIHFALDQLTRDEDVRGSRQYPTQDRWSTAPFRAAYGAVPTSKRRRSEVERYPQIAVPPTTKDTGTSSYYVPTSGRPLSSGRPVSGGHGGSVYAKQPRQAPRSAVPSYSSVPPYQFSRPTGSPPREAPTADYVLPAGAAAAATAAPAAHIHRSPSSEVDEDDGYMTPEEEPTIHEARQQQQPTVRPVQPTIQTTASTSRPEQRLSPRSSPSDRNDVFVPFEQDVPPLRFLPGILRPLWLGFYLFLIILVLAGLIFSGVYSAYNIGLWGYTTFGGGRFFVFQYLPLMISMFLLLWQFQIQVALQRIAPFIGMASTNSKARSEAPLMEYQTTDFLLPKLFYFRAGQPIIGVVMFIFWLQIFDIPLFAALYNVYYFGPIGAPAGDWVWLTVQGIVWALFALYFLLAVALLVLGLWLWRQRTGLRWDPRSLADLVALVDRSNIFEDYMHSEIFASKREFYERLALRSDRLGYWTTSRRPDEAFYGIGEEGGQTRRYSLQRGQLREKSPHPERSHFSPDTPTAPAYFDLDEEDHVHELRHRYLPWYLRTTWVLLWIVAGIVLYLLFLIGSFINDAVLNGFVPLLPVAPNAEGFSSTNFLYSFIPAVIAHLLFLCWLSIDYAFRRLQPYAAMSAHHEHHMGGTASQTLLLDYTARLPISVTIAALAARNFRVAWFSLVSLIAACLPILAGGCFWAQFYVPSPSLRVAVHPPAFYALCVFLAIFAFSLTLLLFGMSKRRLPHACTTLAEQISWLYASRLIGEREWRAPLGSKTEMTTRLMSATTSQERDLAEGHFYFGRFIGKDGRPHIGIDRIGRAEHTSDVLTTSTRAEKVRGAGFAQRPMQDISRSRSGRFVPVAAGAGAATAGGAGTYAATHDDEKQVAHDNDREGLMPRQPPAAVVASARSPNQPANPYRLSESDKPAITREREARQSANYPSGSSVYPSYTQGMAQPSTTATTTEDPFADPPAGASSYYQPSYRPAATAQDSMANLSEADKPGYVRDKYIGTAR